MSVDAFLAVVTRSNCFFESPGRYGKSPWFSGCDRLGFVDIGDGHVREAPDPNDLVHR